LIDMASEISTLPPSARASLLRSAVYAAVDDLSRMGLPPARVEFIVLSYAADAWPLARAQETADEIRRWCLHRYYNPRPR